MGKALYSGAAASATGVPAEVRGYSTERVLRAPAAGLFEGKAEIGEAVRVGDKLAVIDPKAGPGPGKAGEGAPVEVVARIAGVLRGLLADRVMVKVDQKVGDIDPSGVRENCFRISGKARAVGQGVIEAIHRFAPEVLKTTRPVPSR
jgi:xanthine dehydrogenase accessory factor